MTQHHEIDTADEFGILAQARGQMLCGMAVFIAWAETRPAARRAVIDAPEARCGIAAWLEIYEAGRDVCLAIEARNAAEEALRGLL